MKIRLLASAVGCVLLISLLSLPVLAQEDRSADEIAKEMANPNTALTSLKLQSQYFSFDGDLPGADDLDMFKLFLQPTLPFPFENGYTLWVRPGLQVAIDQPVIDRDTLRLDEKSGLGDMTLDIQYGTTLENGFLWSIGFSGLIPTASEEELGSEQWAMGPGFQLGRVTEKTIFGAFANHQLDIAGDGRSTPDRPYLRLDEPDEASISLTAIQLFAVFVPGGGWNYGSQPIMTYNHESDQWTVPLHLAAGKTLILLGRPWKFSVDLNYYVERPDDIATEWMVGFNVAPVVENVFARWFKD